MIAGRLRSEWIRARGRPVEKYTAAVVIVLGVLIPVIMLLASARNPAMRASALDALAFPASLNAARTMALLLGPFWAAALGANVVGAEYQYGTWPWLLVRTSSRLTLAFVKIAITAARIIALTVVGILIFVAMGAIIRTAFGVPIVSRMTTAGALVIPFVGIGGAMAFSAAVALTLTIVSRSVAFGTLIGALTLPLFTAIRFRETAFWLPNVHFENIESRLLTGHPAPWLLQVYDFNMSALASVAVVACEFGLVIAIGLALFRRQDIVY